MQKGCADKSSVQTSAYLKFMVAGAIVICSVLGLLAALHFFLPKESRACILMPGFCRASNSDDKRHFQQLGEGFHSSPKFGLSANR